MADLAPPGTGAGAGAGDTGRPERFWSRLDRDVITVAGPEATAYLQGQLSQDVAALPTGGSAWSWLLAPTGKVDALLRVTRTAADKWLVDTDGGWGESVAARLNRFKLRTKADIAAADATVVALRGDGWDADAAAAAMTGDGGSVVVAQPPWPGQPGADLLVMGGLASPPACAAVGAPALDAAGYEAWRIGAGIPRMGAELIERTIPAETGLVEATVSFTKGCYTGQELVARIDSRGSNVPRRLWVLALAGPAEAGVELVTADGEAAAGRITSVSAGAASRTVAAGTAGIMALGYIRRGVEPGTVLRAGPGGPAAEMLRPAGWTQPAG